MTKIISSLAVGLFAISTQAQLRSIRVEYKPGEITAICNKAVQDAKAAYDAIAQLPERQRSFKTTTLAMENIDVEMSETLTPALFMRQVNPDKAVRDEALACEQMVNDFSVENGTRRDLYNAMKDQVGSTEAEKRLQLRSLQGFEENGLKLSDAKLKVYKKLKAKLVKLQTDFSSNLLNDTTKLTVPTADLKGVRPDFVNSLEKDAAGLKILPVNEATYFEIQKTADNENLRKQFLLAYMNRGGQINTKLLEEAIQLRQQIARLLGFKTWADYRTQKRMAKNGDTVLKFSNGLKQKLAQRNTQDMEQLLAYKKQLDSSATEVNQWDLLYLEDGLKKRDFKLDSNVVREYFPPEVVIPGLFNVYSRLLGVTYTEVPNAPVWAKGVKQYEVRDKKDNRLIGYFYTDFYPRDGKYSHAAAFGLVQGRALVNGNYNYPIAAIVANLSPATDGRPPLLSHTDVETIFHEFGHVMHGVLTRAPYASLSGTSVVRDFVEAPSQMLENWVWEPSILAELSGHYSDHSKKLPKDLLDKMVSVRDFQQGRFYTRQLLLGLFDMSIHTASGKVDVTKTYDRLYHQITGQKQIEGAHFPGTFGHLMGGYDAGYYGYLWSKVYAQDMFTVFQKDGLLSPAAGERYRTDILEAGDMQDASVLLKKFLGREPNFDAFYKYLHIQ